MTDEQLAKIKEAAAKATPGPWETSGVRSRFPNDDDLKQFIDSFPQAVWWKRLPIIRHFRAAWLSVQLARHYAMWESVGAIPWGASKDYAIRDAIWRGEK